MNKASQFARAGFVSIYMATVRNKLFFCQLTKTCSTNALWGKSDLRKTKLGYMPSQRTKILMTELSFVWLLVVGWLHCIANKYLEVNHYSTEVQT